MDVSGKKLWTFSAMSTFDFQAMIPNRIHSKIKSINKKAQAKAERLARTLKNKQKAKNPTSLKKYAGINSIPRMIMDHSL